MLRKALKRFFPESKKTIWLVALGAFLWSLTMVKSGFIYDFGMGFWGPNGHDGVWHISVAESLARGSWGMPVLAGYSLKNYHVGLDLLLAMLHKLTLIPTANLYFQVLPPIFAFLIGILSFKLMLTWTKSKLNATWSVFFVFFGGSFGWLVSLFRSQTWGGESLFWSHQAISTLVNPPLALSLVVILAGLLLLIEGEKSKGSNKLYLASLLFGVLVQIKVYAGLLVLTGLFASGIVELIRRRNTTIFKVFVGSLVVSIILFSPLGSQASGSVVFRPFWFLETMMEFPDRFGWSKFAQAMVNYRAGGVWIKGTISYLVAFAIFILGNFGTRAISIYWAIKKGISLKNYTYIDVFIAVVILSGVFVPMFFVQTGSPWNTIQFMYYSLFFSGLLAGSVLAGFLKRARTKTIIIAVTVGLTIPTTIATLSYHYLPGRPPAKISNEELKALAFLKVQPNGVVLTLPFDKNAAKLAEANPPRPLYLYESTAYVSAFSGKDTYLEDEVNLEITGYPWRERRAQIERTNSEMWSKLGIDYIYLTGSGWEVAFDQDLDRIYENEEVFIYKVVK